MKREIISTEKAKALANEYEYAFVRCLSDVCVGKNNKPIDWDELIDARFFNEESELHIYDVEGMLKAIKVSDDNDENIVDRSWKLESRFGSSVVIRQYLGFDEDGQCFVQQSRMVGWKGSEKLG